MRHHPEPARVHSKVELEKRAHDRAARAKELRGEGKSLRVIADDLGVTKSAVRNYVGGAAIPTNTKLIKRPRKQRQRFVKPFSTSLSADIYAALRASAKASGQTIGAQGRQLIELGLGEAKL